MNWRPALVLQVTEIWHFGQDWALEKIVSGKREGTSSGFLGLFYLIQFGQIVLLEIFYKLGSVWSPVLSGSIQMYRWPPRPALPRKSLGL